MVTPTTTPMIIAIITTMTVSFDIIQWEKEEERTNDKQDVPLPPPGLAGTDDGAGNLLVGIVDVLDDVLRALVDLLDGWLLLLDELGDFLVQPGQLNHILLDFADGGRSLEGRLSRVVCLTCTEAGGLTMLDDTYYKPDKGGERWRLT